MLKNKTAIITGGSRGIGRAIAVKFASNGASVVLVADDDRAALEEAAAEARKAGGRAEIVQGDVARPETAGEAVKRAEELGGVHVLVNCAGIITRANVEKMTFEEWSRVLDVNLNGTLHMCRAVLPKMRAQGGGKIINVSSQMARRPHPNASPSYEVSKAGQIALTRHLAYHYARYGICVNAIAPGSIDTRLAKTMSPETREKLRLEIPSQNLGKPEEVADCALFLASPMSDYVNGATLDVNGGSWMP